MGLQPTHVIVLALPSTANSPLTTMNVLRTALTVCAHTSLRSTPQTAVVCSAVRLPTMTITTPTRRWFATESTCRLTPARRCLDVGQMARRPPLAVASMRPLVLVAFLARTAVGSLHTISVFVVESGSHIVAAAPRTLPAASM